MLPGKLCCALAIPGRDGDHLHPRPPRGPDASIGGDLTVGIGEGGGGRVAWGGSGKLMGGRGNDQQLMHARLPDLRGAYNT